MWRFAAIWPSIIIAEDEECWKGGLEPGKCCPMTDADPGFLLGDLFEVTMIGIYSK